MPRVLFLYSRYFTSGAILLQTDAATPVGDERAVAELIVGKGFRLAMVGQAAAKPRAAPSPDINQPDS